MTKQEMKRLFVIKKALEGGFTVKEASMALELSERQIKRLKQGVRQNGDIGIIHGNFKKNPINKISDGIRKRIIGIAGSELYRGFNFTHLTEEINEKMGVNLSVSTISRILKQEGYRTPQKHKHKKRYISRERKTQMGMLIQVDGSSHDWLEGRGSKMSLIGAIDDATGNVVGAVFRKEEDLEGYFIVLEQVISNYGIPLSLYSDRHAIFVSPNTNKLTIEEELDGKTVNLTQFGRALEELNIIHIKALSPQAKGRIERLWKTFQDRLIKELRLLDIRTKEEANNALVNLMKKHNKHFSVIPLMPEPVFREKPRTDDLKRCLCVNEKRKASNGSTIKFYGKFYHLLDKSGKIVTLTSKNYVTLFLLRNGDKEAFYNGNYYKIKELKEQPRNDSQKIHERNKINPNNSFAQYIPPANHPWRKFVISEENLRK